MRTRIRTARWLLGLGLALLVAGSASAVATDKLSKEDLACLHCHDQPGQRVKLANGEVLSLHVAMQDYAQSVHYGTACEDCHADVDAKTHGKGTPAFKSQRGLALSMADSCRSCHKKKFVQYEDSVHAAMVRQGDTRAPLCSSCHNPHTTRPFRQLAAVDTTPCANCHQDMARAIGNDVHGSQRATPGRQIPLCADCHQAHAIKAAAQGDSVRDACLSCHKGATATHATWLPNTDRHFSAIACPVCHAPGAPRRLALRLVDRKVNGQLAEKSGVPRFTRLTDSADPLERGLDERALFSLLKEFDREGAGKATSLQGRLELRNNLQAHQLTAKDSAVRDCKTCHQAGAEPFQVVTLTIVGPDGRALRHGVRSEVLRSAASIESVRGFYAIGSNRIRLLDQMLVVVVAGALSLPLGHLTLKRITRRLRQRLQAESSAGAKTKE